MIPGGRMNDNPAFWQVKPKAFPKLIVSYPSDAAININVAPGLKINFIITVLLVSS
jgi:hypothetical protein